MKINDIITFVKAGYKPAEIVAMESPADVAALLSEGIKKDDVPAYLELLADSQAAIPEEKEQDAEKPEEKEEEDRTNYKEMYETLLKEKQQREVRKNMAGEMQDDKKTIEEIVRSFL